MRQRFIKKRE